MKRIIGIIGAAALFAYALAAQNQDTVKNQEELAVRKMKADLEKLQVVLSDGAPGKIVSLEGGIMSEVKGAPYSADQVSESTQMLADGTRIHNETKTSVYRDGQGRIRRESGNSVSIWDPVAGVSYILNPSAQTVSSMNVSVAGGRGANHAFVYSRKVGPGGPGPDVAFHTAPPTVDGFGAGAVSIESSPALAKMQTRNAARNAEPLGTQMMEGVNAEGTRETSTIDAGAIGNDRPIQVVTERWYSSELQMDVMTRRTDPRTGEQVMRLTNIRRGEPDPSLFQVPAGYQYQEGKMFTAPKLKQDPQQ